LTVGATSAAGGIAEAFSFKEVKEYHEAFAIAKENSIAQTILVAHILHNYCKLSLGAALVN
jgi:hypothetical protein